LVIAYFIDDSMKKEQLIAVLIPLIYIIGIIVFICLMPSQLLNVSNFIAYMASLSTIVMVLVYLFTASRQLYAMNKQLGEMEFSRKVQSRPLMSLENPRADFDLPQYYTGPSSNFSKISLLCRLDFKANLVNIGNESAIAAALIPKIVSQDNVTLIEAFGEQVGCISLKEGGSQEMDFFFLDANNKIIETILKDYNITLKVVIVFRNILGTMFKQNMDFSITTDMTVQQKNILKSCLKKIKNRWD
jgi:hypothetical protein